LQSHALSLNDLQPFGVTTTAAGTTDWVVDLNENVYVYNNATGALLGSWSAGGLIPGARLTGIATNGTDIWLVDSNAAKVYKYTGAASRLSGSQNAASSFALAGGKNGDSWPEDIVTDGKSFWVVDGMKRKVFKYTLSGASLGSWAIDPANSDPTGITIDPSNVSNIWIVDNGTDKVYQYTAAAARTSGSQSAAATFALAPGDTNPQGIADPPPSGMMVPTSPASTGDTPPVASEDGGSLFAAPPQATASIALTTADQTQPNRANLFTAAWSEYPLGKDASGHGPAQKAVAANVSRTAAGGVSADHLAVLERVFAEEAGKQWSAEMQKGHSLFLSQK